MQEVNSKGVTRGITAPLLAALLITVCYNLSLQPGVQPTFSQLKTFSSYKELESFLNTSMERARQYVGVYGNLLYGGTVKTLTPDIEAMTEHSTTNVQVAGVDESDIVKTDGTYLYVVSGPTIYILRAYPPDQASILSKIDLNETYDAEIYLRGNRLVVRGNKFQYRLFANTGFFYPYLDEAFVKVYDVSDHAKPALARTVVLNGTLDDSRMIGDYVYAVVNQPATLPGGNETDFEVFLPKIYVDSAVEEVQPTEIRYVNVSDTFYYFTTVLSLNVITDAEAPTYESFLAGSAACMYVSSSNMYLAIPNITAWIMPVKADKVQEETLIYRVEFDREKIVCQAEGTIPGYMLNQFSMDEYNGIFRIATTTWMGNTSRNDLFTMDMSLKIVGRIEDLAPGERIFSARFMADRCYLVTFRQVDPFFVIDLSNPADPRTLGYLEIPGFSGYLHPYDENHIIGIGKQDSNLKLSLFDVTNVNAPTEKDKYIVQGNWSESTVLWDHRAFLFDGSKQLLALPVSIWWTHVENNTYYVENCWQGAYVFDVSLEQGFTLRGSITHANTTDPYDFGFEVKRILYIGRVLYTVSDKTIQMHDLDTLEFVNELKLS